MLYNPKLLIRFWPGLSEKLIVIQAAVDGQSGNFILDTGVPNLVLNASYFAGEPTQDTFHGLNGVAGNIAITFTQLTVGANCWKKVYAEVIALHRLEDLKGVPIHGLLGSNLFRNYTLLIDFQEAGNLFVGGCGTGGGDACQPTDYQHG